VGEKTASEPKKPLANEPCAIRARERLKEKKRAGVEPLCGQCAVKNYTVCAATGHVLCSKRKDFGWIPVPFGTEGCGLFSERPAA